MLVKLSVESILVFLQLFDLSLNLLHVLSFDLRVTH